MVLKIAPVLQVQSGQMVSILDPQPADIRMTDIASALSKICRYNGHTREHYSVAEHSVHIYRYLKGCDEPIEVQRAGLMHDAPEYLVGDMTKPLKTEIGEAYDRIEDKVWAAISRKYRMPYELPDAVKSADLRILMNEKKVVFDKDVDWGWSVDPLPGILIQFWFWRQAYHEFMQCAEECGLLHREMQWYDPRADMRS